MAGSIRIKINNKGIGDLLRSEGVKAHIKERAERVAEAASSATDMEILVEDRTGTRARYRVFANSPKAKAVEAKDRVLGSAIDAARY